MQKPLQYFSGKRALADIRTLVAHARGCTASGIHSAAAAIVKRLKPIAGLSDVELIELPADGKTFFGGWVQSKAWDVKSATLKLLRDGQADIVLADYRDNPLTLMMWSPPTPKRGVTGEVVIVSDPAKYRGSLKGKFVLVENLPQLSVTIADWAARAGAVGLISDFVTTVKGVKEGKYLDKGCQYRNYTNAQWDGSQRRLPAFSLTPEKGRILRKLLGRGRKVRLQAQVDSRLYNGVMPLVSARLAGKSSAEVVLTAHMDEPGANDNASGTAVGMEMLRALAQYVKARRQPLKRSVKFLASVELRGLQAHLNSSRYPRRVLAGINVDMIGCEPPRARSVLGLLSARPATPSVLELLLEEALAAEAQRRPRFRWSSKRTVVPDDCQFAGPPFNAPMCLLHQSPDRTYHTSLDTVATMSQAHLQRVGQIVAQAVLFYADAGPAEIDSVAERVFQRAQGDLRNPKVSNRAALDGARRRWAELSQLLPDEIAAPSAEEVAGMRQNGALVHGYLYPKAAFDEKIADWSRQLNALAAQRQEASPAAQPVSPQLMRTARAMVPAKQFVGYLGWEDLSPAECRTLKKQTGITPGWSAPGWLQWALDLANGKRTVAEIQQALANEGARVDLIALLHAMQFLKRQGKVRLRRVLQKKDLLAAVRKAGVRRGDLLMAHTSLSEFGYFEGGADAVIDALLEAVGPEGTLCVPTHSLNWVGAPPYDPKTSPSVVGAVTNVFLKRPQAVRSLHPTHSVAAIGPMARALVTGHDHTGAPMARDGFWGHFYDAGGKVLMMCKLTSNTLLHCGELWGGVPFPPCEAHILQDGRRVEFTLPSMPWHVHSFEIAYASLRKQGLLRIVPLGESKISLMPARPAVDALKAQIERNPLLAVRQGCECRWCRAVKARLPVVVGVGMKKPVPALTT